MSLSIQIESVHTPDALELIRQLTHEMAQRYNEVGLSGSGNFQPADMDVPGAAFVLARLGGVAVGCGAIRPFEEAGVAEVKRMFVQPAQRGQGIARRILAGLEDAAHSLGYHALILETGDRNPEAIGLYERSGFAHCDCWGSYRNNPWSLCFRKSLASNSP